MFTFSDFIKLLASLAILAWAAQAFFTRSIKQPPGILVAEVPKQGEVSQNASSFQFKTYTLKPLANYEIKARVLSYRTYWWDSFSDLSPVDFALGWQGMSDTRIINQLHIYQDSRFYFYSWNIPASISAADIIASSANVHLIPATSIVRSALKAMRVGQIVRLKGILVEATKADGFKMSSSLSRTDTGAGACELMYVEEVE